MNIKNSFATIFIFFSFILFAGFPAQTLVKCGDAHVPIEQLNVGDIVDCYNVEHGYVERPVTHKISHWASSCICIIAHQEALITSHDQKFYMSDKQVWQEARLLRVGDVLLRGQSDIPVVIEGVIELEQSVELFDITVKESHNFLVSRNDILVHNIVPLALGLSWVFGSGAVQFAGASAALGGLVLLRMHQGKSKKYNFSVPGITMSAGGKSPDDPNKKKENEKKHPNGTYQDASYHHKNSRSNKGGKSPSPIDGQAALDNSVEINKTTSRRVGVSNAQIVVLDETSEGIFHGHVRSWDEITHTPHMIDIEKALRENGLVNKLGKIRCK